MKRAAISIPIVIAVALVVQGANASEPHRKNDFRWPDGKIVAVTLSYDDSLPSHFQQVAPALETMNLRGTFYVTVDSVGFRTNLDAWRKVAAAGHELGNHSLFHPCRKDSTGEHDWLSDDYNLSNYTPNRWRQEMRVANMVLQLVDRKTERTFGNTCCDNSIGPLDKQTSLEELTLDLFVAARGEITGTAIDPQHANMPALGHYGADARTFEALRGEIEAASGKGHWVFYMIHGVGKGTHDLYIETAEHQKLLNYLNANRERIWTAPAVEIAKYISQSKN